MSSAVAVLTYRRFMTLDTMMTGLAQHCAAHRMAIFEDCGQRDETARILQSGRYPAYDRELLAFEYHPFSGPAGYAARYPGAQVFMGRYNLGVAGNSNRALRWFMEDTDADHLCLCNDDLHVDGDFVDFYAQAHRDLGVGLFCFCDFDHHPSYKWTSYRIRGYEVKFLPRFTGIMMSITRELLTKVGYMDGAFRQFGEEHCDFTIRCRFAGGIRLEGQDMNCLDVEHKLLRHQECESSVSGQVRAQADKDGIEVMRECTASYTWRSPYRPYHLLLPRMAGGYSGGGIPVRSLFDCGYKWVEDLAL